MCDHHDRLDAEAAEGDSEAMSTPIPTTGNCDTTYGGYPACKYARKTAPCLVDDCLCCDPLAHHHLTTFGWRATVQCPCYECDPADAITRLLEQIDRKDGQITDLRGRLDILKDAIAKTQEGLPR